MAKAGKVEQTAEDQDSIDIGALFTIIWAGKWLISLCVLCGILLGFFIFVITPKVYQADALAQLESKGGSAMGMSAALMGLGDSGTEAATEIEIIRSRLVLGQAVATLHLDWYAKPLLMPIIGVAVQRYNLPLPGLTAYARRDEHISLGLLQVDQSWIEKPIILTITSEGHFEVSPPSGEIMSGQVGVTLNNTDKTFALRVASLIGAVGRQFEIRQRDELDTISDLSDNLTVGEKSRNSGILLLKYKAESAVEAARVLNAVSESYTKQNIARSVANTDSGLAFLDSQMPLAEKAVRDAENELNDYRRKSQVFDLSFESQSMLTQIEKINADLQTLQMQEDEIEQRYTKNHPVYQQLLSNRERLNAQLARLRVETEGLPETQRNILNMTHKLELTQQTYTELQTQAQSTKVLRASDIGSVRIIDMAQAKDEPIAPRGFLILALSTVMGSLAGIALVFLRKWWNRGIQGTEEIERLGLPVFATINYTAAYDISRHKKTDNHSIFAITDPGDIAIEAFRSLRTSLHFSMLDTTTKSLVVTSAAPGVGKSFVSVNLATVMAQGGMRVCLIDADMRRGGLRKFFNQAKNTPGLSEYLSEANTLDQVLQKSVVEGLFFIGTGRFPPNPADLLLRPQMADLLRILDQQYDMIIVDCPPVLAVTDPVLLGRIAGAILVVTRFDHTSLDEIEATKAAIEVAGLRVAGAVLNGFDPRKATKKTYRYDYKSLTD